MSNFVIVLDKGVFAPGRRHIRGIRARDVFCIDFRTRTFIHERSRKSVSFADPDASPSREQIVTLFDAFMFVVFPLSDSRFEAKKIYESDLIVKYQVVRHP